MYNEFEEKDFVGKTVLSIDVDRDNEWIEFTMNDGDKYRFYHDQDCCERVYIEDICGDLDDLIGSPLLLAEEITQNDNPEGVAVDEYQDDSFTWTFYKFATTKGRVTVRWYGESNGYYSESVDVEHIKCF